MRVDDDASTLEGTMAPRAATAFLTRGWQRVAGGHASSAGELDPGSESRMELLARGGKRARLYTGAVVFVALLGALVVLSAKNTRSAKLDWGFGSAQVSLVLIIVATAAVGWVLGITTAI